MMKKIFILPLFAVAFANAQNTGVNTTSPTNTLDVNGTLRVRDTPLNTAVSKTLVVDANGVVGTTGARYISSNTVVANNYVEMNYNSATSGSTSNYTLLNVENTVTVPAGAKYGIFTSYSVPVGSSSVPVEYSITSGSNTYTFPQNFAAYVGVGFFKNGTLLDGPTRKFSFPTRQDNSYFAMTTISANYYEVIDNSAGTAPINITYALQGYLENMPHNANNPSVATSGTVRFNMWAPSGNNYNWGKSALTNMIYQLQ